MSQLRRRANFEGGGTFNLKGVRVFVRVRVCFCVVFLMLEKWKLSNEGSRRNQQASFELYAEHGVGYNLGLTLVLPMRKAGKEYYYSTLSEIHTNQPGTVYKNKQN